MKTVDMASTAGILFDLLFEKYLCFLAPPNITRPHTRLTLYHPYEADVVPQSQRSDLVAKSISPSLRSTFSPN
jgi:hypothetical protein